ncbi:MAG: hypothetical protein QM733_15730 [Ilumatobacteraceae bacterium]
MARRTIRDATQWLEDNALSLNPAAYAHYEAELRKATAKAQAQAEAAVDKRARAAVMVSSLAMEGLCAVRDRLDELTRLARSGQISRDDLARKVESLRADQRKFNAAGERVSDDAEWIEGVEADPIAFHDQMFEKFPALERPEFSF